MKKRNSVYVQNTSRGDGSYKRLPLTRFFLAVSVMLIVGVAGIVVFWPGKQTLQLSQMKLDEKRAQNDKLAEILEEVKEQNDSVLAVLNKLQERDSTLKSLVPEINTQNEMIPEIKGELSLELYHAYTDTLTQFLKGVAEKSEQKNIWKKIPVISPVKGTAYVQSREFGMGVDPFTGVEKVHPGVNFAAMKGTPVQVTADGVVEKAYKDSFWGNRVEVNHRNGVKTIYTHLQTIQTAVGRRVGKGDVIGIVGSTGWSVAPEVHYEILQNGEALDPISLIVPDEK